MWVFIARYLTQVGWAHHALQKKKKKKIDPIKKQSGVVLA